MTNPIQQLVDAAKMVGDESTCCDEYHEAGCPVLRLRAAILAVESAEVETCWRVQRSFGEDRWEMWPSHSLKVAQALFPKIVLDYPHSKVRIVCITTIRTVEKEQ